MLFRMENVDFSKRSDGRRAKIEKSLSKFEISVVEYSYLHIRGSQRQKTKKSGGRVKFKNAYYQISSVRFENNSLKKSSLVTNTFLSILSSQ